MIAFAEDTSGISVSFEFFPPKPDAQDGFWATIAKLETVNPSFVKTWDKDQPASGCSSKP